MNALDPSFQEAVDERDSKATIRYLEGVAEGRRLQAEKDKARILRYRGQREEARSQIHRAEEENARLRVELRELRDAFMAMQMAYEEQISAMTLGPGQMEEEVLRVMELQDALLNEANVAMSWSAHEASPVAGSRGFTPLEEADSFRPASSEDVEAKRIAEAASLKETPEESPTSDLEAEAQPTLSQAQAKGLLDQLTQNPICHDALLRLRSFCLEAHRETPVKRTEAQKYLLREAWRIPTIMGRQASDKGLPPTSLPEIFVDASGQGIGFWWKGKWAAWKLNKGWMKGGREISWGEMVAVELGLRTLIAAGVKSTQIRVRSDNQQVVTALSAQYVRNPQEARILGKILTLCREHKIVVVPIWVWTKSNPADSLSRCQYPAWDSHVDAVFDVPEHLEPYVYDVKRRSA